MVVLPLPSFALFGHAWTITSMLTGRLPTSGSRYYVERLTIGQALCNLDLNDGEEVMSGRSP